MQTDILGLRSILQHITISKMQIKFTTEEGILKLQERLILQ